MTTPTKTTPTATDLPFAIGDLQSFATNLRDLNEKVLGSVKNAGLVALDAYEQAVNQLVAAEQKVGDESKVDGVSALVQAQVTLTRTMTTAYLDAARAILN
jgi:TRAP-type C4-dicarboxylate transport system substrate-binding protein